MLTKPENAEVLERSIFSNTLFYRKGMSWTRIFADLEKTVPYNVKHHPGASLHGRPDQVPLDMTVGAESPQPFIELLKALENRRCSARCSTAAASRPPRPIPLPVPRERELCPEALISRKLESTGGPSRTPA